MASKTGRKANKAVQEESNAPVPKDDGTRWLVVRHGRPVYAGATTRAEAERLASGLLYPASIIQVNIDTPS